jgi:hypothetical protein
MTDNEPMIAYQAARSNYEAADAGSRAEMFIKLLVAERVLSVQAISRVARIGSFSTLWRSYLARRSRRLSERRSTRHYLS